MKNKVNQDGIKRLFHKSLEVLFTGVILAVVASLLTTYIIERNDQHKSLNSYLSSISDIYIGCNKLWVDEHFGNPQFITQKEEYILCAYVSSFFVVQIAFDKALSAQAYFITSLDNEAGLNIKIDDKTLQSDFSAVLGDFSYYDFPSEPIYVFGFVSNGNARAFYSEAYYFMSGGNYYQYYLASFDFGRIGGSLQSFLYQFDIPHNDIDDEVTLEMNRGVQIITDRRAVNPNSYGVSSTDINDVEILFGYDWFNSQQLRNKLNGPLTPRR